MWGVRCSCQTFNETVIFSRHIGKNVQIWSFMGILPVGAELFHVDGPTDLSLIFAFARFKKKVNEHKMCGLIYSTNYV
jgi:hypothetical protein